LPAPAVLIVDDETIIRWHIAEIFEDSGCHTEEASSADEALALLETNNNYKAVFTDIRMPGHIDGLGLAHEIAERWPFVEIIICSGNELPMKRDLPKGARFLAKPVQQGMLVELAEELCAK
jgi:two-component system, response regulator PdtaR